MENRDICSICGGKCCKKSGCDYAPSDFNDLGINSLHQVLLEGKISIVSAISFERLPNGDLFANPILYLRARNSNRPIVDLLSAKTTCSQLSTAGCNYTYEERPSGGKNLIPVGNNQCYPAIPQIEIIKAWDSYQRTLAKLVKRISGNSIDEQLKIDVEKLFIDILNENFKGVMDVEVRNLKEMYPLLIRSFPHEYLNVLKQQGKAKIKTITK